MVPTTPGADQIGQDVGMAAGPTIEGYDDLVRIGRGGLGDVYRATQVASGAEVAIKVLRDISDTSMAWHRTRRELTALRALSGHSNVVQVVDVLELEQGPALVMEFAPGGSVADLLDARGGTVSVDEAVFVGRQVAAALVSAHVRGIVHRDIKPQNLLIDGDGQVKLCDFGIAALTRDDDYRSRTNAISMRYASPEDLEHDQDVGPASDVYSLGATLLHMTHGAPPSLKDRLAPWTPPGSTDAATAALDRVIARCLHPNPALRPTAQGVLDALDGLGLGAGDRRVDALDAPNERGAGNVGWDVDEDPREPDHDGVLAGVLGSAGDVMPHAASPPPTGERLPDPPRPAPHAARRYPALLAGFVLGLVVVAVVLAWPRGAEAPVTPDAPTIVTGQPVTSSLPAPTASVGGVPLATLPRPADLPALDALDWDAGRVGDCLVQVAGEEVLTVVNCARAPRPPARRGRIGHGSRPGRRHRRVRASGRRAGCDREVHRRVRRFRRARPRHQPTRARPASTVGRVVGNGRSCVQLLSRRRGVSDRRRCPPQRLVSPDRHASGRDDGPAAARPSNPAILVVETGVDPVTPRFSGVCSAN
jgi:hypothetical protein